MYISNIRNFSIIAHVDHGKSTLADRFIEISGAIEKNKMQAQMLDSLDIERERGITVKSQCVRLRYTNKDNDVYYLNLIDTPGHVDFSYEVSRSLSACEGALLVVDTSQGVEAQSIANCYTAISQNLIVIPVLNKVDLPSAEIDRTKAQIEDMIGLDTSEAIAISAKTGLGVSSLLENIIETIPAPSGDSTKPLRALIVDSWFDSYVGVVSLIRVFSGTIKTKQKIKICSNQQVFTVEQVGYFSPQKTKLEYLRAGEVGFISASIKDLNAAPVGDTIIDEGRVDVQPLAGFKTITPKVFAGLYPISSDDYSRFRESLQKLCLNDSSLVYEPEKSSALGLGFRCGFLGLLHMEIVQERLEREYQHDLIVTAPTVVYQVVQKNGELSLIHNPEMMQDVSRIKEIREPYILAKIIVPHTHLGAVIKLCMESRATLTKQSHSGNHVNLEFEIPMSEVVSDFFDQLKSVSRGYASYDYEFINFRASAVVKMDILINEQKIDALSVMIHKENVKTSSRKIVEKLKELIPRQMVPIAIQAAVGGTIHARSSISALRKNVLAKCYGGDITRKRKLLEKQKEGKKRMKSFSNVDIPQEAFMMLLGKIKS